ncbi:inositol monophosphatase family protein [Zavarzinia compransoris]|uniref:Histidinol-phosphatase n=1 Tax=Zavarzinia compransoris TaxID=1264899 RepID=A0A317E0D3_9PROT|nr:inositol monophosphatase family protein [Zavarzinia compransoris]PWR18813.1 histidinol-phosphatase [Zavarzinia compransoris]TDP48800.1 fructose-1,6-bisphosphatase/inositol monophosphatase family enzyme [Zavarzinia compransoris]
MTLSPDQIEAMTRFAGRLADAARAVILPYFRTDMPVDDKADLWGGAKGYDPVTAADKGAEAAIRALIEAEYPGHGILGEEYGEKTGTEPLTWVLDPIDGTRAFITGLPLWGTLIALNDGTAPVIGVMDQPYTGERFTGNPDGAFLERIADSLNRQFAQVSLNRAVSGKLVSTSPETALGTKRLKTRACPGLAQARLMTTSPHLFRTPETQAAFTRVADRAQLVRYGGDCYAYAMVAAGQVDAVIETNLEAYDIQALIPIVRGAGGQVTDWTGGDAQAGGSVVATGDARVHAEILALLNA